MKKTVLLLVFALLLSTFGAFAAETATWDVDYNQEAAKVEIRGNAEAGELVTVQMFLAKNHLVDGEFSLTQARNDLLAANYKRSVLVYTRETKVDEDGTFGFDIKMRNLLNDADGSVLDEQKSEIYAISLKIGSKSQVKEYLYVDPVEQAADFVTLGSMASSSKADVISFLQTNRYSLGAYVDILDELETVDAYDTVYDALVEKDFNVSDRNAATAYIQEAITMAALNQEMIENIETYEDELAFTTGELKDWYAKPFVDTDLKANLTERLSGQGFSSLANFEHAAKEALVLEFVALSDGLEDVKNILNAYDEDIWNEDYDDLADEAIRECMGTSYSTVDALIDALLAYEAPEDKVTTGTGNKTANIGSVTTPSEEKPVTPAVPQEDGFKDMNDASWAKEAVEYMTEKGILSGRGDGTFAPNDNVTRAEFVKMVVKAFGLTEKAEGLTFVDVAESDWYYEVISIAVKNGLAGGMSDEFFGAKENISRQDMAVILYNAAKASGKLTEAEAKEFTDAADIAEYAKEAVNMFTANGVINGNDDGTFAPRANATRAQAAQIVYNLLTK